MKIQSIGQFYNTSFKAAETKSKEKRKLSTTEKSVYGIAGAAALGIGAYFILRGKGSKAVEEVINKTEQTVSKSTTSTATPKPVTKIPLETPQKSTIGNFKPYFNLESEVVKKDYKNGSTVTYKALDGDKTYRDILVLNQEGKLVKRICDFRNKNGQMWSRVYKGDEASILVHPDKLPKGRYDSTYLVKEFSGEAKKPFGSDGNGHERLTTVAYPDGHSKTYQGFFNKNKLHEYTIYHDRFDNSLGCFNKLHQAQSEYIINYNYAYKDGKLAGIAQQERLKDNNWYGIQHPDWFEGFPQYVDFKDGKGFNEFKGDLYIRHPEFDPDKF